MSYLLLFIYLIGISYILQNHSFFKGEGVNKWVVSSLFYLKFLSGIGLYLVYVHYYNTRISADIFKYFDDGNIIHSAIQQNPWDYLRMLTGIGADSPHLMQYYDTCTFWIKDFNYGLINDNRLIIRFNALVRLISMGNIHIHTLFINFLSFIGLWSIFKVFNVDRKKISPYLLLPVIFLFPSLLFWGSGVLKEGLLLFAFGLMFYAFNRILRGQYSFKQFIYIAIAIGILLLLKFYVLVAAIPGFTLLISTKYLKKNYGLQFVGIHLLFVLLVSLMPLFTSFNFVEILANKQNDFLKYTQSLDEVGSEIAMDPLEPNLWHMAQQVPQALVNSFFRPTVWEANSATMTLAALENLLIVLLMILTVLFFKKGRFKNPLILFSLSFVLILFTLIGLTTPVLGALVRYKVPALPFLGIILLYLINTDKLFNKIPYLNKYLQNE